jgi:hypothetical protein
MQQLNKNGRSDSLHLPPIQVQRLNMSIDWPMPFPPVTIPYHYLLVPSPSPTALRWLRGIALTGDVTSLQQSNVHYPPRRQKT